MKKIIKIVITGGPCAGKSTAMSWIRNAFSRRGYTVLFVPETATELITGGVAPWTCRSNADYQKCQVDLQLTKERLFIKAAEGMPGEKILIVCDRGVMDNRAYMTAEEFGEVVDALGGDEVQWRDSYDAVFHLITAANGAEDFYSNANNSARYESVEEARALDDRLIAAWTGHRHLRIIDNSTDFEGKMLRLESEIAGFLTEDHPYEMERKFLIEYPDMEWLESHPLARKIDIEQVYLKSDSDEEIRIRKRGENGHYIYYETHKRPIDGMKRLSTEKRLSKSDYRRLMKNADPDRRIIRKKRYCLSYDNQYFEIDIYPFWKDKAILEIELMSENETVHFPGQIRVIREVTDDPEYKNASLAMKK
ncbi:MAG: AAA family ATPase [Lachnospiraceae bacterium]|nr:AAA family ATPase [Lachnospiraceae bacterium]